MTINVDVDVGGAEGMKRRVIANGVALFFAYVVIQLSYEDKLCFSGIRNIDNESGPRQGTKETP